MIQFDCAFPRRQNHYQRQLPRWLYLPSTAEGSLLAMHGDEQVAFTPDGPALVALRQMVSFACGAAVMLAALEKHGIWILIAMLGALLACLFFLPP